MGQAWVPAARHGPPWGRTTWAFVAIEELHSISSIGFLSKSLCRFVALSPPRCLGCAMHAPSDCSLLKLTCRVSALTNRNGRATGSPSRSTSVSSHHRLLPQEPSREREREREKGPLVKRNAPTSWSTPSCCESEGTDLYMHPSPLLHTLVA